MIMGSLPFKPWTILQVTNDDVSVNVGQGKDLIQNDPTPELIQVDLYFPGATRDRFAPFLNHEITPRFPNGLTNFDSNCEPSQIVTLVFEDTQDNERSINQIADAYEQEYGRSVVEIVNENVAVGFGQGEDLIENDPIPELIQVDLYFGRNIGTTGQVTETQFQQFLHQQITPLFADGLVVYDARGQFLDSQQQLIREPSKVVSLITEDSIAHEQSINQIIAAYKQQFQQESVLAVVDETIGITVNSCLPGFAPDSWVEPSTAGSCSSLSKCSY
jgi:hypothetical protein